MNTPSDELRRLARERIESRRGFVPHLIAFVLVNAGLIAIWATTGQGSSGRASPSACGPSGW